MYRRFGKRLLDIVFSVLLLALLSPVYLVLAVLVRLRLGSPVIFSQERPGLGGKIFRLYKFRTMTDARDESGRLLPDVVRLTPFGMKLRSTSLDELPQIWNILRGEMSFIGPRPLIPDETTVHELRFQYGVYQLRPGISGYAQVHGRDMISDEKKAELDKYYLDHFSFRTDVKILIDTVLKVLGEKDIHQGALQEEENISAQTQR